VGENPEIPYPCHWTYQVIGEGEDALLAHLDAVLANREHAKRVTRKSSAGRYTSIEVVLVVASEAERMELGRTILRHAAVRFVV
jgi:putative lipoic acid-binding regulatory protein